MSDDSVLISEWKDYGIGEAFPGSDVKLIRALERPLNTQGGYEDHYVAMKYHFGNPCMGRVWNEAGKLAAVFVSRGQVLYETVGSVLLLINIPPPAGYHYSWRLYSEVTRPSDLKSSSDKGWRPVHVGYHAPCVLTVDDDGHEYLGEVNLKVEQAFAAVNDKMICVEGGNVANFKVLCRKQSEDVVAI